MYGMIHRAMRQMVFEQLGEDAWLALGHRLGIGPTELLTGQIYDDALTFEIISEAADRFNLTVDQCLTEFGRYWIRYAEQGALSSIMKLTGQNLASFIANLDRLHVAVGAAMPGAQLPSFTTLQSTEGHLTVEYRSDRVGMEKFVHGLFLGLMERFNTSGVVTIESRGEKSIVFEIRYKDMG
jgi:guanylate cyclase soluble subunit beta